MWQINLIWSSIQLDLVRGRTNTESRLVFNGIMEIKKPPNYRPAVVFLELSRRITP